MLIFNYIKYKNFLSVGNAPVTLYLSKSPTTLVYGMNGHGKSSGLDALMFALFGKAFRNINKPQLINSTNEKDCFVECEFSIGKNVYRIERGMKPNIFNIYSNNKLINQDSKARDYQKYLEQTILKMNEKSFRQIIVLGSASFVPFMQLPLAQRREVIEDLLDISIFSSMNRVLKVKYDAIKDELKELDYKNDLLENQYKMQKQFIETNKARIAGDFEAKKKNVKEKKAEIKALTKEYNDIQKEIDKIAAKDKSEETLAQINSFDKVIATLQNTRNENEKLKTFFMNNDSCPVCAQGIKHDHKNANIAEYDKKIVDADKKLKKANTMRESLLIVQQRNEEYQSMINTSLLTQEKIKTKISIATEVLEKMEAEIDSNGAYTAMNSDEEKLKKYEAAMAKLIEVRTNKLMERDYYDDIAVFLKDTGIKTKIIKHYLPIMNSSINKYLIQLGLNINFTLDETFSEKIKSRGRDDFTYFNFSEGEKARINLAIMFAWRHIAAMKNSTNTNLLIMDETFDSSLDGEATDELLNLINALADSGKTNVFVISHKSADTLYDKFRSAIEFKKINGFSKIV